MGNDFCNVSKRVKDLDLKTEFGIIDENSQEKDLKILNQEDKLMDEAYHSADISFIDSRSYS